MEKCDHSGHAPDLTGESNRNRSHPSAFPFKGKGSIQMVPGRAPNLLPSLVVQEYAGEDNKL